MKLVIGLWIICGAVLCACSHAGPPPTPDPRLAVFDFLREKIKEGHVGVLDYYLDNPSPIAGLVKKEVRPLIRDTAESVLHSDGRIYDKALKRQGVRLFIWDIKLEGPDRAHAKGAYYFGYDGGTEYGVLLRLEGNTWKVESSSIRVQS